jgi:hypothetical protein
VANVNEAPSLVLDSTTAFTEDASGNQVGSVAATFTASDIDGDDLTITLSDTTNYQLDSYYTETFETLLSGWTNGSIETGSTWGPFLGRFTTQDVRKSLVLDGTSQTIEFDFLRIDSWDGEKFRIYSGDNLIFEQSFRGGQTVATVSGSKVISGEGEYSWVIEPVGTRSNVVFGGWDDQKYHIALTTPSGLSSLDLGFTSTLNQAVSDESWGLDNFEIPGSIPNRVLLKADGLALVNNGSLPAFTLQASDGSLTSSAITVTPTVTNANDAPSGSSRLAEQRQKVKH